MPRVQFYQGPYDGKECDLPFLPSILIGDQMDGDWGSKGKGNFVVDTRISRYIYQLTFPNGENEPFEYRLRNDYPEDLFSWFGDDLPPKTNDDL